MTIPEYGGPRKGLGLDEVKGILEHENAIPLVGPGMPFTQADQEQGNFWTGVATISSAGRLVNSGDPRRNSSFGRRSEANWLSRLFANNELGFLERATSNYKNGRLGNDGVPRFGHLFFDSRKPADYGSFWLINQPRRLPTGELIPPVVVAHFSMGESGRVGDRLTIHDGCVPVDVHNFTAVANFPNSPANSKVQELVLDPVYQVKHIIVAFHGLSRFKK